MQPQAGESEFWMPVPVRGFSSRYDVSTWGRVRSSKTGRVLRPSFHKQGYARVVLFRSEGRGRYFRKYSNVHRLVAKRFLARPAGPMRRLMSEVNHKDCNTGNNHVGNLQWVTPRQNVEHAEANGRVNRGESHGNAQLTEKQAATIIKSLAAARVGKRFERGIMKQLGEEFGVSGDVISMIARGVSWKHLSRPWEGML